MQYSTYDSGPLWTVSGYLLDRLVGSPRTTMGRRRKDADSTGWRELLLLAFASLHSPHRITTHFSHHKANPRKRNNGRGEKIRE